MTKARRIGALVLALGAGASLAACSSHPGTAAIVDGRSISPSDVRDVQTEIGQYLPPEYATTPGVLTILVREQAMLDFAASHGAGASEADADKALAGLGDADATYSDASRGVAQYIVASGNIANLQDDAISAELTKTLDAIDVTVNPRYGTTASAAAVVAPTAPAWIVPAK